LYQESKTCEADYKNLWKGFKERLEARDVDYPSLDKLLIADKIIEKVEEQEEVATPAL
tara:strand:- start:125 stop:298 length:174 start_codon:yes stop_codon:yes gene_type:complete